MHYRTARPDDIQQLSEVAFRAKSYWGYPSKWLDLWKSDLTISEAQIERDYVLVAQSGQQIAGFIVISRNGGNTELEHLWVNPDFIRQGVGTHLYKQAMQWCLDHEVDQLKVVSDPNAQGFYESMGGELIDWIPSVPAPRRLPVLKLTPANQPIA